MAKKDNRFHIKSSVHEQYFLVMPGGCSRDKAYQQIRCDAKQTSGARGRLHSRKDLI